MLSNITRTPAGGVEDLPYYKIQGCSTYRDARWGYVVWLSLRVFSLKRFTAGALVVPFTVLSRKSMIGDMMVLYDCYL